MTIALTVALICAVLVHQREVSLLSLAPPLPDERPFGWIAVFFAAALSFVCGASFAAATYRNEASTDVVPDLD